MISVQNRLQPLSGNSMANNIGFSHYIKMFVLLLSLAIILPSCHLFKPVPSDPEPTGDTELDPITGKVKDRENGSDPVVINNGGVDTLKWKNPKDGEYPDPISDGTTDTNTGDTNTNTNTNTNTDNNGTDPNLEPIDTTEVVDNGTLKGSYKVGVLMPFFTDKFVEGGGIPASSKRSLRFYEGIKLGLRRLETEGIALTVNVYDTKRSASIVSGLFDQGSLSDADLVLGPVDANAVRVVGQKGLASQVPVVPLNAGAGLANENMYFIQGSPTYQSHCDEIVNYVSTQYPGKKVVMVARNNSTEVNRFSNFNVAKAVQNPSGSSYSQFIPSGGSKAFNINDLKPYMTSGDTTVIIVPSRNEAFVYGLMRDLSILRRTYPVVVIGMPSWAGFTKIDVEYYENLNVHISSSTYINQKDINVMNFKTQFFNEYGIAPTDEAYKGYDLMVYFGRMLHKHGSGFISKLDTSPEQGLHTDLKFEPVFSNKGAGGEGNYILDRYENKSVNILRFKNFYFQKVN